MLIRLLGVEEEAKAMQGAELPFNDVPKWASGYVAYAYENGLTNGLNKVQFGSTNKMDAKAFMTFLLRSLGYNDQAGDFSYNNALSYAQSIDLVNDNLYSTMNNTTFLRAFIAKTAYDALNFPYKGGDVILIDKLMAEDKIDPAIGAAFKKTVFSEPESMTVVESGSVDLEDNLESVVMLECYGNYSDRAPEVALFCHRTVGSLPIIMLLKEVMILTSSLMMNRSIMAMFMLKHMMKNWIWPFLKSIRQDFAPLRWAPWIT